MSVKQNFRKLLLVSTSCAFFAACADTSISSPGGEDLGTPPGGGNGGGGSGQTTIDLIPAGGCGTGSIRETSVTNNDITINACEITGNITTDTVIAPNAGVIITGPTFIGLDDGAVAQDKSVQSAGGTSVTLEIGAGATLFGSSGSDYIVVTRGSRTIAASGAVWSSMAARRSMPVSTAPPPAAPPIAKSPARARPACSAATIRPTARAISTMSRSAMPASW